VLGGSFLTGRGGLANFRGWDDPPGGKSNTWEPVYGAEVQAHGSFDEQAHAHSPELWVSQHRGLLAAGVVAAASAIAVRAAR
jgi:hypothetical protein